MPLLEPDSTDPMELTGVALPDHDDSSLREMAECFIEEYIRLGFTEGRVLALFANPHFAAPHRALKVLGEETIRRTIEEMAQRYRPFRSAAGR